MIYFTKMIVVYYKTLYFCQKQEAECQILVCQCNDNCTLFMERLHLVPLSLLHVSLLSREFRRKKNACAGFFSPNATIL